MKAGRALSHLLLVSNLLVAPTTFAMQALDDQALSEVAGQALFYTQYTAPDAAQANTNFGFYRVGIEAQMQLNANIKSLRLGCDGPNGTGPCDISIDNLSLSGNGATRNARVESDAIITNPFFEVAIKNPNSASTREIAGVRFSAANINGLLTTGVENSDTPNGINSVSGYMKVQSDSSGLIKGFASTAAARDDLFGANEVQGTLLAKALGLTVATARFKTVGGGFNIPQINNNPFSTPAIVINGSRVSSVTLNSVVNVPSINLNKNNATNGTVSYNTSVTPNTPTGVQTRGGPVVAEVISCSGGGCTLAGVGPGDRFNDVQMAGNIRNIRANLELTQALGMIHSLPINSASSLSLQKESIKWPGSVAADTAQAGWWLSLSDPVNIGNVIPANLIDINPLFPQISAAVTDHLSTPGNEAETTDLAALLFGGTLDVNIGNIDLSPYPLSLPLSNLKLATQDFAPNCYGSLTFC